MARLNAWSWPCGLVPHEGTREAVLGRMPVGYPAPGDPGRLLACLRDAGAALRARPALEVADVLGEVGERFAGPLASEAARAVAENSGLSPEMAAYVVAGAARGWSKEALRELVEAEFPGGRALDGLVDEGSRRVGALGGALTLHLGAGSVPGVTVTSMIRCLLVKSPALVKPGAADVALTVLFARELAAGDADLSGAVAVQYWPGGDAAYVEWESALFRAVDRIVVYGGPATVESVRRRAPATTRLVEHSHKLGVAMVRPGEGASAARVARAVATFDQGGCVSTQLVCLVAPLGAARDWCMELCEALEDLESTMPTGESSPAEQSAVHQLRGRMEMKKAGGEDVEVWYGGDRPWTVVLAPAPEFEPVGRRTVWVAPCQGYEDGLACLEGMRGVLQTVGIEGGYGPLGEEGLGRRLMELGASRVVPLSEVPFPAPDWLHDGGRPLGELVGWGEVRGVREF